MWIGFKAKALGFVSERSVYFTLQISQIASLTWRLQMKRARPRQPNRKEISTEQYLAQKREVRVRPMSPPW